MSRKKQEITKNVEIRFRVEPELKKKYFNFCKEKKYVLSKRIRDLIEKDLNKNKNG